MAPRGERASLQPFGGLVGIATARVSCVGSENGREERASIQMDARSRCEGRLSALADRHLRELFPVDVENEFRATIGVVGAPVADRSEERRVGKEGRERWAAEKCTKTRETEVQ